jgi:hypothetical protein
MTSEQIKQFRLRAIQQGYSPQEINDYLSSGDTFEDRKAIQQDKESIFVSTPRQEQPKRNLLQKTAGFLGVEKFGQGLATQGRVESGEIDQTGNENAEALLQINEIFKKYAPGTPERKRAMDQFNKTYAGGIDTQAKIDPGTELSNKEVLGSAANVALNVATPTAFKGGFGAQVAKNASLGAGFGAAGGLNDKKDLAGIIASAFTGAAIGAAIPVAGKALNKAKTFVTASLPESLMNHAIKPTLNELKKNIKTGSPTLGKELLEEGVSGSPEKLLKISDKKLSLYENKLQSALKSSKATISREELRPYFDETIKKLQLTPGSGDAVVTVESLLADVPQTMDLATANTVKRNLYDRLRDVAYKLDPKLSDTAEAMKTLARGLKEQIEQKSDNPQLIQEINKRLSIYGRLEDRTVDILARGDRNKILSLTDTIAGAAGFLNPLAWYGLVAKKALESETVLTKSAQLLNKGQKVGTGKAVKVIKAASKRILLNTP